MSWEIVKLSEVSNFIRNGLSIKQDSSLSGVPITRIETISDRTVNLDKCGYAGLKPTDNLDYKLEKGDILISHINSPKHLGKSAQFHGEEHLIHGMNLLCLRPNDKIDARYLYLAINSSYFLNQLPNISNKSVNQASFKVSDFKNLNVHLPPLPEQQRIADILDKAEAITQKREQALALCDEFLRATFLDMFGNPVSNPKGWSIYNWEKVIDIKNGKNQKKVAQENGKYAIFGSGGEMGRANDFITPAFSVIIGRKGNINDPILITESVWNVDTAFGLVPDTDVLLHDYLYWFCFFFDFLRLNKTVTIPSLRKVDLYEIQIPIPPIELQQKFSRIVDKVNTVKARIQQAQELPLFDALSQQAFKGELTQ